LTTSASSLLGTNFTIEFWIYFNTFTSGDGNYQNLFGVNNTISTTGNFIMLGNYNGSSYSAGALTVFHQNSNKFVAPAGTFTLGRWHHVALVRNAGTSLVMYVDGSSVGSAVINSGDQYGAAGVGYIVATQNGFANRNLNGYISNLRVVNGTALYTSAFTPSTTPLTAIANTSLLTCQSTTFIDNSNNAFAITINGDAKPVIQNPFTDTVGTATNYSANTFGSSIFFDNYAAASGDYLSVSGIPISATGQFTFEAWLYTTSVNNADAGLIYSQYTTGDANRWTINLSTANKITVTNPTVTVTGATTFPPYQWNHVAVTRDSSNTLRIFLNGVVDATSASYTYSIMQSAPRVGYYNNTPNDYWNGFMSSVRVVRGQALYTVPFVPSNQPAPVTSNTTLLLASTVGPSVTDATRNHNIETFGTARYVANNSPYYDTYSAFFDGSSASLSGTLPSGGLASGSFCVEGWIYPITRSSGDNGSFFDTRSGTSVGTGAIFGLSTTNGYPFIYTGGSFIATASVAPALNTWSHLAYVRNGSAITIYLNGVSIATGTTSNNLSDTAFRIASTQSGAAIYFQSFISNFRVVVGSAVYTTAFTPSVTPLTAIANTVLLTCQTNAFKDVSTSNLSITKAGAAKITAVQPFAANNTSRFSSVYFAAKTDVLSIEPDPSIVRFSGDFTFECWVYPTDTTTTFWGIWDSRNAGASATSLAFTLDPLASAVAGSYRMSYYNGTKYYGTTTVLWNQWTHVAWVRSGTTMTFYVNGVAGGTATISGAQIGSVTSTPIYIGSKDNALAGYGINGYISDLRITNGYARTITVPTAPYDIK
jgi:hypothetical protein